MKKALDTPRILIFLAFAFGFAWATALVIYLTGGLVNTPMLGGVIPLSTLLMATTMMWAPALSHVLTRLITREGWHDTTLYPHLDRHTWIYYIIALFIFPVLTVLGGALYYALFPQHFDPQLGFLQKQLDAASGGQSLPISIQTIVILQVIQGVILGPLINSFFTFGEEFGWRGYLQPKLMVLGGRRAMLLIGLIWGVWHWPVIFMGYEYQNNTAIGFEYPGAPISGPLMFLLVTLVWGIIIGWLALRGRSVWPAVLGHASVNGIAALPLLWMQGNPNILLGPMSIGVIGLLPALVFAAWLFLSRDALEHPVPPAIDTALDAPPVGEPQAAR